MDAGGEIARSLDALYEFSTQRLLLGNATADPTPLREALVVLETLAEGWSELLRVRRPGGAGPQADGADASEAVP